MRTDRVSLRKGRRVLAPSNRSKKLAVLSAAAISIIQIESARAQLYWDLNGPAAGAGGATPAGNWDNLTPNWNTASDGTGAATTWSGGTSAVFSAGTDATGSFGITLNGAQSATGVTLEEGSVTFSGDGLNLTGGGAVASGSTAQFNNVIGGIAGLNKTGTGTVILAANNTLSGPVVIGNGTLALTSANPLANVTSVTISNVGSPSFSGGNLVLNASNQLNSATDLTINNGTSAPQSASLYFNAADLTQQVNSLNLTGARIDLNGGTLGVTSAFFSRAVIAGGTTTLVGLGTGTLDVGSGSVLFSVGSGAIATDLSINAQLHGSGTIYKTGDTDGGGAMQLLKSNSGFTGALTSVGGRTQLIGATGGLTGLSALNFNGGTLEINNATNLLNDRVNDAAVINAGGNSTITLVPNAAATTETLGAVTFVPGNTAISIGTMSTGDASLTLGSISRQAGSSVIFTTQQLASATLGVTTGGITPKVTITSLESASSATYLGGGYVISTNGGLESAIYDPTTHTVRAPVAGEFTSTDVGNGEDLRIPDATAMTIPSGRTLNSITLAGSTTITFNGNTTITSGQIVKSAGANAASFGISTSRVFSSGNNNELIFAVGAGSLYFIGKASAANTQMTKMGAGTLYFALTSPDNPGTLTINGGTVQFSSAVGYNGSGTIVINAGTIQQGQGTGTAEKINDSAWIYLNGGAANQSTIRIGPSANVIEHIGTLTMQGGGVLTQSAANMILGLTQDVIRDGSVGAGAASISVATVNLHDAMITFNIGHNPGALGADMNVSSNLTSGGLIKTGTGTLTLSNVSNAFNGGAVVNNGVLIISGASNTYTGGITLNGGALRVSADGNLGSTTSNDLHFNGGTLSATASFTLAAARNLVFDQNANIDVTASNVTLTSSATFSGNAALVKVGPGILTLNASNSFAGGVQLNQSRINFNNSGAAGSGDITANAPGNGTVTIAESSGTATLPNNINLVPGSGTIDFVVSGTNLVLNGIISGNSGLIKGLGGGAASLTLNNTGNSFTGLIGVNAGTLVIPSDSVLGPTTNNIQLGGLSSGQTQNSAILATGNVTLDPARSIYLSATNAASFTILAATSGSTLIYNGSISGPGTLTKTNSGTLQLGGSNAQVGGTALNGGILSITSDGALGAPSGPVSFNGGALFNNNVDLTISAPRSVTFVGVGTFNTPANTTLTLNNNATGSGGPTKVGAGTLVLGGNNTFSGFVAVNGGVVQVAGDSNLGTAASVTFNGGTLLTAGAVTSTKALIANGIGTVDGASNLVFGSISGTGTFHKTGTGVLTVNSARPSNLVVDTGTVAISTGRDAVNKLSNVKTLSIVSGAALDLNANDLILDYTNGGAPDPAQLATVRGLVSSGYAGGAWTGKGVTSTAAKDVAAATLNLNKTALGYAEASTIGVGTFDGTAVDGDMIVVRYTFSGDANLDGVVDTNDFTAVANNFNSSSNINWVNGDFNFDGVVNALDFNALATNYALTLPSGSLSPGLGTLVPEPASLAGAGLAAYSLMRRRRVGAARA